MCWFKSIFPGKGDEPIPPEGMNTDQEKQWRISLLTDDEHKAFEWFRQGYTARWTAETMLLDRRTAKRLFDSVYRKLCVADAAEVTRVYRTTKLTPEELPPEDYSPL
jgi:DNA-binding CsgD family transcriptional regulator